MLHFFQIEVLQLSNVPFAPWLLEVQSVRQEGGCYDTSLHLREKGKKQKKTKAVLSCLSYSTPYALST